MTVEYEKLVVLMEASIAKFDKDIQNIGKSVDTAMRSVEDSTGRASNTVVRNMNLIVSRLTGIRGALTPLGAAAAAVGAIRFGENIIRNIDSIRDKALELGVVFDADVVAKLEQTKTQWEQFWIFLELRAAKGVANIGDFVGVLAAHQAELLKRVAGPSDNVTIPLTEFRDNAALLQYQAAQASKGIDGFYSKAAQAADATALGKFIDGLKIAAQLAKATADQHEIDLKLIEAANAVLQDQQKAAALRNDHTPLVSIGSVDQARSILGASGVANVESLIRQQQANETAAALRTRLEEARANAAHPGEIPIPGLLTPNSLQNDIGRGAAAVKQQIDRAANESKYLDDLKEESRIAGLLPQQREAEIELLRVKDRFGAEFADQHENEIRALVKEKQAAEELAQVHTEIVSEIANFGDTMEQAGGKFGKAVEQMLLDITKLIVKLEITKTLESSIGGGGGLFGLIGGLFGGLFGGASASGGFDVGDIPGRAVGGAVSAGAAYMVGEKGRELFVPNVPGTIYPSGRGPGGSTQININVSLDGANGDQAIVRMAHAAVVTAVGQVKQQFPSLLADAQMRHF